jgi:hypothetical protein
MQASQIFNGQPNRNMPDVSWSHVSMLPNAPSLAKQKPYPYGSREPVLNMRSVKKARRDPVGSLVGSAGVFEPISEAIERGGRMPSKNKLHISQGFETNRRVTFGRMPRPWKHADFKSFQFGQVLFCLRDPSNPPSGPAQADQTDNGLVGHITIPQLNWLLTYERMPDRYEDFQTVAQRMSNYRIDGIAIHQFGGDDHRGYAEVGQQRINIQTITQSGLTNDALKLWGSNIRNGTKLYLVVKRVRREQLPEQYYLDSSSDKGKDPANPAQGFVRNPFQVIPWCSTVDDTPPPRELEYVDDDGIPQKGGYYYIGLVKDTGTWKTPSQSGKIQASAKEIQRNGQFSLFLDHMEGLVCN